MRACSFANRSRPIVLQFSSSAAVQCSNAAIASASPENGSGRRPDRERNGCRAGRLRQQSRVQMYTHMKTNRRCDTRHDHARAEPHYSSGQYFRDRKINCKYLFTMTVLLRRASGVKQTALSEYFSTTPCAQIENWTDKNAM
jgi:hypothetical protein